jgi:hypothetical protein
MDLGLVILHHAISQGACALQQPPIRITGNLQLGLVLVVRFLVVEPTHPRQVLDLTWVFALPKLILGLNQRFTFNGRSHVMVLR